LNHLHDCRTAKEIKKLSEIECKPGEDKSMNIKFSRAYLKNLILGSSEEIKPVVREGHAENNHKHDLLLTFTCPNQWIAHTSTNPTRIEPEDEIYYVVDKDTCEPLIP
jgi:hypothetical protein